MAAYYNEIDPYVAQWLRNLISTGLVPAGDVDARSIADVRAADLRGYVQCHFFAGLGGWPRALRLAGWADDRAVWTGSCPCQPFSAAGKQRGFADDRHLWPEWFRLIRECGPAIVFGEQVARAAVWLDQVFADLEGQDYACGAAIIPACGVNAPHIRERLWFLAESAIRRDGRDGLGEARQGQPADPGAAMAHANGAELRQQSGRRDGTHGAGAPLAGESGEWWSIEPAVGRVAHGVPARVGRLRAYGNAIVPQVAAEFIRAVM